MPHLIQRSLLIMVVRLNSIGAQILIAFGIFPCPNEDVFNVLLICIRLNPFPLLRLLLLSSLAGVPMLLD